MRKSILRFGALALMSLMSIGSWAQTEIPTTGATFTASNGCKYTVKGTCKDADGKTYFKVILKTAVAEAADVVLWGDTTEFELDENDVPVRTKTGWKGEYSSAIGVTEAIPYLVTEIGEKAFSGFTGADVQTVKIPNYVSKIGANALKGQNVTAVDFSKVTDGIGENAFESVTFSDDCNFTFSCDLGKAAFKNATFPANTTVKLWAESTGVADNVFAWDKKTVATEEAPAELIVETNLVTVEFGKVHYNEKGVLVGIKTIGDNAFQNRQGLKDLGFFNNNGTRYLPETLKSIGNYAFQNCVAVSTFRFHSNDYYLSQPPRIETVGKYAFENCRWMNNDVFAASCRSFDDPFTYAEGSFKNCGLTGVLDLSKSKVEVTLQKFNNDKNKEYKNTITPQNAIEYGTAYGKTTVEKKDENKYHYINYLGIPKDAFSGNYVAATEAVGDIPATPEAGIDTLLLNPDFKVIQWGAFEGIKTLKLPKVLPSALWSIEEYAFSASHEKDDSLYLPFELRFIKTGAFSSRNITNILANPTITGTEHESKIPLLIAQTNLTVAKTYIPASQKFTNNTKTLKEKYALNGWGNYHVTYANADLRTNIQNQYDELAGYVEEAPILEGKYIFEKDGVVYAVSNDFSGMNDDDLGCIPVTVLKFTGANPTIHGYIGLQDDEYLEDQNSENFTRPDSKEHQLKRGDYQYPIILKVTGFTENMQAVYKTKTNAKTFVEGISFLPKSDGSTTTIAQSIANSIGAAYKEIPASMCYDNDVISSTNTPVYTSSVVIGEGIETIGKYAFQGTTNLKYLELPSTLKEVGESAFADIENGKIAGLTEVNLPAKLQTIGEDAFATTSLQKVYVNYKDKDGEKIPSLTVGEDPFAFDANGLYIASLFKGNGQGAYDRTSYVAKNCWKNFFDHRAVVKTAYNKDLVVGADQDDLKQIYTVDEDIDGDGYFTKYYVLKDNADDPITQVKITAATGYTLDEDDLDEDDEEPLTLANVPVKYVRTFIEGNLGKSQCWYVPFDYKFVPNDDYKFYYIYNTTQSTWEADAETKIGLKAVPNDKDADDKDLGYATIKANTPYVIVSRKAGDIAFYGEALQATPAIGAVDNNKVVVKDVKNEYTFAGVYQRKGGNEATPWYGISGGKFIKFTESATGINAFRFYMTALHQPNPYNLVKFVFDDEEEDATAIEDVNAETIADGAMFDLMGRQIAAPAKGQVYIQNGVKKLAK